MVPWKVGLTRGQEETWLATTRTNIKTYLGLINGNWQLHDKNIQTSANMFNQGG